LDEEIGLEWYYFGARYYDPVIARWLAVDPKFFASWSSYSFCFNNPIRFFDPDGKSGKDITIFIMGIDKKYRYFWGGKHPNDNLIATTTNDNIDNMSERLHASKTSYEALGISGSDLGYDCSGLLVAANDANPDRSYNLESELKSMEGTGTERLWNFLNSRPEYEKISDPALLKEGDFIVKKGGGHVALLVKDENGKLVIAEAYKTGTAVGISGNDISEFNIGKDYYGFHDKGNDSHIARKRDLARKVKKLMGSSAGWSAEHGSSPR